jgi:hypothetical protein
MYSTVLLGFCLFRSLVGFLICMQVWSKKIQIYTMLRKSPTLYRSHTLLYIESRLKTFLLKVLSSEMD